MFKKVIFLLFLLLFITGTLLHADVPRASSAEELMNLLMKAQSPAERADIMERNKDLINPALVNTALDTAAEVFNKKKTSDSLPINEIAAELAEFIKDKNLYGTAQCQRGNILHNLKRDDEARKSAEKALQAFIPGKNEKGIADVYSLMGDLSFSSAVKAEKESDYKAEEDSLNKALENYQKSLDLYIKLNDKKGKGWVYSHTGDIYYLLGDYFVRQKNYEPSRECYGKTLENYLSYLEIAASIKNPKEEARACNTIGVSCKKLGRFDEALKYYERCLDISQKNHFQTSAANCLNNIGSIYSIYGRYDQTIKYCRESLKIRLEINDEEGAGDAFLNLGRSYIRLGKYEEALKNFEKALNIFEKIKRKSSIAIAKYNFGCVYHLAGKYREAINLLNDAFEISHSIGYFSLESDALTELASVYFDMGEWQKSMAFYQQALKLSEQIGDREGSLQCLYQLGKAYTRMGQYDEALKCFNTSLSISRKISSQKDEAKNLKASAEVYQDIGKNNEALKNYNDALKINENLKNLQGAAEALRSLGNIYAGQGNYSSALSYYEKALSYDGEINYLLGIAEDKLYTGFIYSRLGKMKKAETSLKESLSIYQESKYPFGVGLANEYLGTLYWTGENFSEALKCYREALKIYQDIGYPEGEAGILEDTGDIYNSLGNYPAAEETFKKSLNLHRKTGNKTGEAWCLNGLGNSLASMGNYKSALENYEGGLKIFRETGYLQGEGAALLNEGLMFYSRDEYEKAIELAKAAKKIFDETGDAKNSAVAVELLGIISQDLGDYSSALNYYEEARKAFEEMKYLSRSAEALQNIGSLYLDKKEYDKALKLFMGSLEIFKKLGMKNKIAGAMTSIGTVYLKLKNYQTALGYFEPALKISRELGTIYSEAAIQTKIGEVYYEMKNTGEAEKNFLETLTIARKLSSPSLIWRSQKFLGEIYEGQKKYNEAVSSYEEAVSAIESVTEKLAARETRMSYLKEEDKFEVYQKLIKLLHQLGRDKEALEIFEMLKSKIMTDTFADAKMKSSDAGLQKLLEELELILARKKQAEKQLAEAKSAEETQNIVKVIARTEKEFRQIMVELQKKNETVYSHLIIDRPNFVEIQKNIPAGTAILEYCLLDSEMYIFLATPSAYRAASVAVSRDTIDSLVRSYRIKLNKKYDLKSESIELYNYLIKPVEKDIESAKTLIIVPYGSLYFLPFHALMREAKDGSCQYLLQWKRVSYLTTSALLKNIEKKTTRPEKNPTVLAFGDPDGSLEYALEEVNEIGKIFGPSAKVLTLDKATKGKFLALSGDYSFIHFATHGILDPDPTKSRIVLAPKGTGDLTVMEIYTDTDLDLKASLLMLSACSTAVENLSGETAGRELLSLASAFSERGASTLIATLWKVADISTEKLVETFYLNIKSGKFDKLEALRDAQLKLMKMKLTDKNGNEIDCSHPFYWAPFIFLGSSK